MRTSGVTLTCVACNTCIGSASSLARLHHNPRSTHYHHMCVRPSRRPPPPALTCSSSSLSVPTSIMTGMEMEGLMPPHAVYSEILEMGTPTAWRGRGGVG